MAKPQQIRELEEQLGVELDEVKDKETLLEWNWGIGYYLLNKQQQIIGLNLSSNKISDISPLQHLTQLTELKLGDELFGGNEISDISPLQHLTQLSTLYLSDNKISDISPLQHLTQLSTLYLSSNQISDISPLQDLAQLTDLKLGDDFLGGNKISDISPLQTLTQLSTLDLSSNKISDISPLQHLTQLSTLYLSSNQISDISSLQHLTQLSTLDLSNTQISDISPLQALTQLNTLDLRFTQISDISPLQHLTQLRTLYLHSNKISDVSPLQHLTQLTELKLGDEVFIGNEISDISPLQHLTQLSTLDLSFTQISDILPLQYLTQLSTLYLSRNKISQFNLAFLQKLENLKKLYLYENPIQNIPKEIFDKNQNVLEPVRNYLEDLQQGKSYNKILKIIFIGNGSVGKTQIAKRLAEQESFEFNSQHDSTHAIVCLQRLLGGIELQLWDFAGQDIYHATHRLFMQTRALFVLVWDIENEQQPFHTWEGKRYKNEKLPYWLEYAQCFGKNSPLLVLQNKVDSLEDEQKCLLSETQNHYQERHPILGFVQVSAKTGRGFFALEDELEDLLVENPTLQEFLHQELPNSWIAVRSAIEALQEQGQKTMKWEDFQVLCRAQEVEKSTSTILTYLHDTGVLYYNNRYFGGKIILNQSWAIEAVYQILDRTQKTAETLRRRKGRLNYKHICRIWTTHSDAERELFMDFMLSTELCFETTVWNWEEKKRDPTLVERNFVVPAFLPTQKPLEVDFLTKKQFIGAFTHRKVRVYRFLPTVFMQRFIVAANRLSHLDLMWQQGIWLQSNEGVAIVEADYTQREIVIQATTSQLLHRIENELVKIGQEGKVKAQSHRGDAQDPVLRNDEFMRDLKGLCPQNTTDTKSQQVNRYQAIRAYIKSGKLNKAFEATDTWVQNLRNQNLQDEFALLRFRYQRNERRNSAGLVSQDNYVTKQNNLTQALLKFLEELKEECW